MPEEDLNEMWLDLLDCLSELKSDAKDNRRMKRHIRNLEAIVNEIGVALSKLAGKRGFLR